MGYVILFAAADAILCFVVVVVTGMYKHQRTLEGKYPNDTIAALGDAVAVIAGVVSVVLFIWVLVH